MLAHVAQRFLGHAQHGTCARSSSSSTGAASLTSTSMPLSRAMRWASSSIAWARPSSGLERRMELVDEAAQALQLAIELAAQGHQLGTGTLGVRAQRALEDVHLEDGVGHGLRGTVVQLGGDDGALLLARLQELHGHAAARDRRVLRPRRRRAASRPSCRASHAPGTASSAPAPWCTTSSRVSSALGAPVAPRGRGDRRRPASPSRSANSSTCDWRRRSATDLSWLALWLSTCFASA